MNEHQKTSNNNSNILINEDVLKKWCSDGFTSFIYLRLYGPSARRKTMTPVTAAVGGVILATFLRLQYSHIVKCCLIDKKEGLGCKFRNDWHREGDEFHRAEAPSSWERLACIWLNSLVMGEISLKICLTASP